MENICLEQAKEKINTFEYTIQFEVIWSNFIFSLFECLFLDLDIL